MTYAVNICYRILGVSLGLSAVSASAQTVGYPPALKASADTLLVTVADPS